MTSVSISWTQTTDASLDASSAIFYQEVDRLVSEFLSDFVPVRGFLSSVWKFTLDHFTSGNAALIHSDPTVSKSRWFMEQDAELTLNLSCPTQTGGHVSWVLLLRPHDPAASLYYRMERSSPPFTQSKASSRSESLWVCEKLNSPN